MTYPNKMRNIFLWTLTIFLAACNPNDQKAFQQTLAVKSETLQIDNTKDTLIFGSKGTGLFFEKESFELPDGTKPKGKIVIQLKECYTNADIVRENLSTTSNGQLLETRGMINVAAFSGSQALQLKQGKKFIIHFPKDSSDRKKQMNLFYANDNGSEAAIDWKLDTVTILKPTAYMSGWFHTGHAYGDSTKRGFYFKGEKTDSIFDYFYKHFDNTKLQPVKNTIEKAYLADFIVSKQGKIKNLTIQEEQIDSSGKIVKVKSKVDPYLYTYIENFPLLEPFRLIDGSLYDSKCSFNITMGVYPPDYRNNDNYNRLFNEKYGVFKNRSITSMDDAELDYYIFSSTKLGWINCDFFWDVQDEKIDYIVKTDPAAKPNIKLVFKNAKSILTGTLVGEKYIFKNVPINQDIKIVAISFEGNKPLLSVSVTKTGKQVFDKFDYRAFALADLEKELNNP